MSDHVLSAPSDELPAAHGIVMHRESAHALAWERAHAQSGLSAGLLKNMETALAKTPVEVAHAYEVLAAAQAAFPAGMDGLDFLITPSAPGEAPVGLASTGEHSFNFIWTSLHVPCVTVPAGTGPNRLPLGVQIVGRPRSDKATLVWAQWVAAALA